MASCVAAGPPGLGERGSACEHRHVPTPQQPPEHTPKEAFRWALRQAVDADQNLRQGKPLPYSYDDADEPGPWVESLNALAQEDAPRVTSPTPVTAAETH
jgi:hypothetical protein